jgi:hypothetical protein
MSDIQILTGLSILISGYLQLPRGLSCYHWQVIVYLAWFSSLTHLSCLTFLRSHLYNRPRQRAKRLIAMLIILVMLMFALIPTGSYLSGWRWMFNSNPAPSDYAICYLIPKRPFQVNAFGPMVISMVLLWLGFMTRAIRLHKSLSVYGVQRIREFLSKKARKLLRKLHVKCGAQSSPGTVARTLVYRPLLAAFLVLRVMLDFWSSMLVEVRLFARNSVFPSDSILRMSLTQKLTSQRSCG